MYILPSGDRLEYLIWVFLGIVIANLHGYIMAKAINLIQLREVMYILIVDIHVKVNTFVMVGKLTLMLVNQLMLEHLCHQKSKVGPLISEVKLTCRFC